MKNQLSTSWLKRDIFLSLAIAFSFLALIPIITYVVFAQTLSSKDAIMNKNNTGLILLNRNGKPFFSFYQAKFRNNISLSQMPVSIQKAAISSEDKDFYSHPGFSLPSIARSLVLDIVNKQAAYGGSTITQQLVKNALLSPSKSLLRKYEEVVLAQEIERRYSKDEILEMYLNSVYFGEGAFGVEEAAQRYFGKDAKDLTLGESALLVGVLPSPSTYSPLSGSLDIAKKHQKIVLDEMAAQGYISQSQATAAYDQKLTFASQKNDLNQEAPHFALYIKNLLANQYGEETISRSGFTVKTSIDLTDQAYAETVVKAQVDRLAPNRATNGAAVVMDPKTGEILAYVGSKDWDDEKFGKVDMANTPRQPGSSFKPIVYGDALEKRIITPATILQDKPTTFPGNYKPLDYDKRFRGPVTVRRALDNSLNIPAVEVLQMVGVNDAIDKAHSLGITTLQDPSRYGLSLVLGSGEVKLVDMTDVYATFANNGQKPDVAPILEIKDKDNKTIYKYDTHTVRAIDDGTAFLLSSILSDNATRAEEFGNTLTISRPAAVKTGTTEDFRDAWTIGYTPSLVVGVWVGNNDNTPMDNIAGSLGAAPIWRQIMERLLAGTSIERFTPPDGVVQKNICIVNGSLSYTATSSARFEYFLSGSEPERECPTISTSPTAPSSPATVTISPSPSPLPSVSPTAASETLTPAPPITVTPTPGSSLQIEL